MPPVTTEFRARLATGTRWTVIGAVASRCCALVAGVAVARLTGQEGFGAFTFVQTAILVAQAFAGAALATATTHHLAQWRDHEPARAGRVLALLERIAVLGGMLLLVAMWLVAGPLAARFAGTQDDLAAALRIGAVVVLVGNLTGYQQGALLGLEAFRPMAVVQVVTGLAVAVGCGAGAALGGVAGAMWGHLAGQLVALIAGAIALHRALRDQGIVRDHAGAWRERAIIAGYLLPLGIGASLYLSATWLAQAYIAAGPDGLAALGVYGAASQCLGLFSFLPLLVSAAAAPVVTERWTRDRGQAVAATRRQMLINALLVVIPGLAAIAASPFIAALFGADFRAHWPVFAVTIAAALPMALFAPWFRLLIAAGRMWQSTAVNAVNAVVLVVGTVLLAGHGALGLAIAKTASHAIDGPLCLVLARRISTRTPHA